MFHDWENFNSIITQGIPQKCVRIGNNLATNWVRIFLGKVLCLGRDEKGNEARYTSTMYEKSVWLSNVIQQDMTQQR